MSANACEPVEASNLMKWAKELPDYQQHSRQASVRSENGFVFCSTHERAGSSSFNTRRR